MLQILHVQKAGLQFHERCISIYGYHGKPMLLGFSGDDRRLLEYRFEHRYSEQWLSPALAERIRIFLSPVNPPKSGSDYRDFSDIRPVREWKADHWYVYVEGSGRKIYSVAKGSPPPQEFVDLFDDLNNVALVTKSKSELRDVCLGFCYDPLSAMGLLYANDRCSDNGHRTVCR